MPVPKQVIENGAASEFTLTPLLTFGKIPKGLTQAPVCGYALKLEVALLVEEVARVAQKSSCTAQSCCEQQWTAHRQTESSSLEANGV